MTEVGLHRGEHVCALSLKMQGGIDERQLQQWVMERSVPWQVWVNDVCIVGSPSDLFYDLPDFAVRIPFAPSNFTQINPLVNRALVAQAVEWLAIEEGEEVMDLFAGLGNFSLPIARRGAHILAVEGVQEMVRRGAEISSANGLAKHVKHIQADLFEVSPKTVKMWAKHQKWLLDPPRAGAHFLMQTLSSNSAMPKRMVYVSCDAATLARDAKVLKEQGYRFIRGRVANMFAQTAHIESISVFERR